jgi:hypothetical protein
MDSCGDRWIDACTFFKVLILSILLNQATSQPLPLAGQSAASLSRASRLRSRTLSRRTSCSALRRQPTEQNLRRRRVRAGSSGRRHMVHTVPIFPPSLGKSGGFRGNEREGQRRSFAPLSWTRGGPPGGFHFRLRTLTLHRSPKALVHLQQPRSRPRSSNLVACFQWFPSEHALLPQSCLLLFAHAMTLRCADGSAATAVRLGKIGLERDHLVDACCVGLGGMRRTRTLAACPRLRFFIG